MKTHYFKTHCFKTLGRKGSRGPLYGVLLMGFVLAGAAGLSGCSSDSEPGPEADSRAAIRFGATTDFARTGDITTNNLTAFNVYAYTEEEDGSSKPFMDNVEVTKTATNTWAYSPEQYWPAKKAVDFYAYAPKGWVGAAGPLKPVAYDASEADKDLVYAVSTGLTGNTSAPNAQVIFNFRHALSKVTVKLSSSNKNLQVKVTNVYLSNIASKGNFQFPTVSTAGYPSEETMGKWSDQNSPTRYVLHFSIDTSDIITLDTTPTDMSDTGAGIGGAKSMIPQPLTWRSNGAGHDTMISVMCVIYDAKTGTKLWPNANTPAEDLVEGSTFGDGILRFPLSTSKFSDWRPGCHYIYSIVINSNEEMGTIDFGTPTVDTYVDVESSYE